MAKQAYRATQAFVCVDGDGVKRRFDPTMTISEGHWALKSHGAMFEPIEEAEERATRIQSFGPRQPVEQATAEPGERRATRRPRRQKDEPAEAPTEQSEQSEGHAAYGEDDTTTEED